MNTFVAFAAILSVAAALPAGSWSLGGWGNGWGNGQGALNAAGWDSHCTPIDNVKHLTVPTPKALVSPPGPKVYGSIHGSSSVWPCGEITSLSHAAPSHGGLLASGLNSGLSLGDAGCGEHTIVEKLPPKIIEQPCHDGAGLLGSAW